MDLFGPGQIEVFSELVRWPGRGIRQVPVPGHNRIGLARVGGQAGEVTDIFVLERREVRGRRPLVRMAHQDFGRAEFVGQDLKIAERKDKQASDVRRRPIIFQRTALIGRDCHRKSVAMFVGKQV